MRHLGAPHTPLSDRAGSIGAQMPQTNDDVDAQDSAARYDRDELEEHSEEVVKQLSTGDKIRVVTSTRGHSLVGRISGDFTVYERDYEGDDRAVVREIEWDVDPSSVDMKQSKGEIEVVNKSCLLATYRIGSSEVSGAVIRRWSSPSVEILEVVSDG